MKLNLSDIETNAVKHALEKYRETLQGTDGDMGVKFELEAVECVIDKMDSVAHASGM